MKVRFFYPNPLVLSSLHYPPALRQVVQSLNGHTADLAEAVTAIQTSAPDAVVCAYAGFIAVRTTAEHGPTVLIRFDGADQEAEVFQPCQSLKS
jgi:hypothetical protein